MFCVNYAPSNPDIVGLILVVLSFLTKIIWATAPTKIAQDIYLQWLTCCVCLRREREREKSSKISHHIFCPSCCILMAWFFSKSIVFHSNFMTCFFLWTYLSIKYNIWILKVVITLIIVVSIGIFLSHFVRFHVAQKEWALRY